MHNAHYSFFWAYVRTYVHQCIYNFQAIARPICILTIDAVMSLTNKQTQQKKTRENNEIIMSLFANLRYNAIIFAKWNPFNVTSFMLVNMFCVCVFYSFCLEKREWQRKEWINRFYSRLWHFIQTGNSAILVFGLLFGRCKFLAEIFNLNEF